MNATKNKHETFRSLCHRYEMFSAERAALVAIWQETLGCEVPEVRIFGRLEMNDVPTAIIEEMIGLMLDAELIASTVIDARAKCSLDRDYGFLPALRRV
jgi:hypothetical protein